MNNKVSLNLLKMVGAQLQSVEMNGRKMNCVVIPTDWNCISVTTDKDGKPNAAYLNLREWETSAKFRQACMDNHSSDADYQAPSHQVEVSYTEEFTTKARAAAEARIRKDEAFMGSNPTDEDIKKRAAYDVSGKARIGYVTPLKRVEPAPYTGTAPAAQNVSDWSPATDEAQVTDDLPF